METKIIQHEKNPLLSREEFLIEIVSEKNPTKQEVIDFVAKGKDELVEIKKIANNFGKQNFLVQVFVYDSIDEKKKIEKIPKKIKQKLAEQEKQKQEQEKQKAEKPVENKEAEIPETDKVEEKDETQENKSEEKGGQDESEK